MDQRIAKLLKRLAFLGYCSFEIRNIISEAIGPNGWGSINLSKRRDLIMHLEKYEQLGEDYLNAYSK